MHTESETVGERADIDRVNVSPIELVNTESGCSVFGLCHVGKVREENQDFMGHFYRDGGHVLVVADGMGGHNGGWEASHLVLDACGQAFEEWDSQKSPKMLLSDCVQLANTKLLERAAMDPTLDGMGSTFVGIYVRDGKAWTANLGDSRSYLFRKKELQRLSRDHSRVAMMVEAGLLTEEAARTHPMSNVLEMALGVEDFVAPEICSKPIVLERGDRFVLCSDGLWGLVKDQELLELFQEGDLRGCGDRALEMALNRGGTDNVTLALLDYQSELTSQETADSSKPLVRNRANLLLWELILVAVVLTCVGFTWAAFGLQQDY